jgi:amino acid transporter
LKKWGPFINIVAFIWILFITILFCLPPNELVLWTMIGLVVIMLVYWQVWAKKRFTGPKQASEEELRRVEEELDRLAHAPGHAD